MTARFLIRHELEFHYDAPVHGAVMTLFVSPVRDRRQQLHDFSIETDPGGAVFDFRGPFGNRGHFFDRPGGHHDLRILVRSNVEVTAPNAPPVRLGHDSWEAMRSGIRRPELWLMLQPSRFGQPSAEALGRFLSTHGIKMERDPLESVRNLRSALYRLFEYAPGSTTVDSPIDQILETGRGVCQDYAHVMITIARAWGVPSRYVSGYLHAADPPDQPTHAEAGHAWVECRLPGLGWVAFDPTNPGLPRERYVRVAVGRDYGDVSPARGIFRGWAGAELTVEVTLTPRTAG